MAVTKNLLRIVGGLIAVLLVPVVSWAACTGSSPAWTSTPDYASVNSCVGSATSGDTINVLAGSATWNSTLTITKGINLIGAGIGNTNITVGASFAIDYESSSNSQNLRISGFTFNLNGHSWLNLQVYSEPTIANIRIDHNRVYNSSQARAVVYNNGCFGVIDNNVFESMPYPFGIGYAGTNTGQSAWNAYSDDFWGTSLNMYVEDNTISYSGAFTTITDCDEGGRYAFRYNTFTSTGSSYPMFDTHEWGTSGYGCMGGEIYGNRLNQGEYLLSSQGAGRDTAHHNIQTGGLLNLYSDGDGGCSPALASRQKMNNNYFYLNRVSNTGSLLGYQIVSNACGQVVNNSTFWMDNSSCIYPNTCSNITTGVGCGPLANRPTSCTTGVGYWATNQSCTDLTGMVGANPSTPIAGTLYKCTSTNTWTAYYTPYTYPHSLRDDTRPLPPSNLRIIP